MPEYVSKNYSIKKLNILSIYSPKLWVKLQYNKMLNSPPWVTNVRKHIPQTDRSF